LSKRPADRPVMEEVARSLRALLEERRAPAAAAIDRDANPFAGVRALGDRRAFFGRDAELAALLEQLRSQRVVAIVGGAGTGKTSLVEAGLVPALESSERWTVIAAGSSSALDSSASQLAERAARERSKILIVADDFDRLLAALPDEAARLAF